MPIDPQKTVYYKRARFTTRLPLAHRFVPSHYWLSEESPGVWRVGLTKFATRMLGDLVECRFDRGPGDKVEAGDAIGTIEGFKAVSEIYCVAAGVFADVNAQLSADPSLLDLDPYDRGWLYLLHAQSCDSSMDVAGYIKHLDATIDRMLEKSEQDKKSC